MKPTETEHPALNNPAFPSFEQEKPGKRHAVQWIFIILVLLLISVALFLVIRLSNQTAAEIDSSQITSLTENLDSACDSLDAILQDNENIMRSVVEMVSQAQPEEYLWLEKNLTGMSTIKYVTIIPSDSSVEEAYVRSAIPLKRLVFQGQSEDGVIAYSESYLGGDGSWCYTMKAPVIQGDTTAADVYIEFSWERVKEYLPVNLYGGDAAMYFIDGSTGMAVVRSDSPGVGRYSAVSFREFTAMMESGDGEAGQLLKDGLAKAQKVLFYHTIFKKDSLIFLWPIRNSEYYLIGFVPTDSIQRSADTVRRTIITNEMITVFAFIGIALLVLFITAKSRRTEKQRKRDREAYNQKLRIALDAANAANRSKTAFLSNMSHDIRTPMNAIMGFATLVLRDPDDSGKVREYTKKISYSSEHLLSLINEVLEISRIESGKNSLSVKQFNIKEAIDSTESIIRTMAEEKHQEFIVSVAEMKHSELMGDQTKLNQILINLLSNAVKYTPEHGHIGLDVVGLKASSESFEKIRFVVRDDGYGMTEDFLKVLFEPFSRAENSTTNKVVGTGLGMAITKNFVDLMGGIITVESQVGVGSTFTVELSFKAATNESAREFWENNHIARVLLLRKEEAAYAELCSVLTETGLSVDAVSTAEEAVRLMEENHAASSDYDLLILDEGVSETGMIEAVRNCREGMGRNRAIVLCAVRDMDNLSRIPVDSVDDFIHQPVTLDSLMGSIREFRKYNSRTEESERGGILSGKHFLAAEDNEINAEILVELLKDEGAECDVCENGQLVVEQFNASKPGQYDAILMDVMMPVMNGNDAARAIRDLSRPDARKILIIAMTANAFAEDVQTSLEAGMNAHIAKPLNIDVLKKTLSTLMEE